jgi:hypothetical protein
LHTTVVYVWCAHCEMTRECVCLLYCKSGVVHYTLPHPAGRRFAAEAGDGRRKTCPPGTRSCQSPVIYKMVYNNREIGRVRCTIAPIPQHALTCPPGKKRAGDHKREDVSCQRAAPKPNLEIIFSLEDSVLPTENAHGMPRAAALANLAGRKSPTDPAQSCFHTRFQLILMHSPGGKRCCRRA